CGQLLIASGSAKQVDIDQALKLQVQFGGKIGEILVNQGVCTEDDVLTVLSKQLGLPRLSAWESIPNDLYGIDLYGIEKSWWVKNHAFPLGERDGQVWVALADVLDLFVAGTLKHKTG